ncbi:MAG: AmmeMemoRadiSam system radical SAM enzyme [Elusimicrobia bacterium RIFOXYA2_FULL_39_19]|nr:MAG: AmmeMemoRadiSam system radical SAM enzyme [Elusimicrobia bacterium RIFOXYA2_FULL_39_19]
MIKCRLCPWECTIKPDERGICTVRENKNGTLYTLSYSRVCSINIDPIEKKPFFHFFPGQKVFSIATPGCNMGCRFCQNWSISQVKPEDVDSFYIPPENLIKLIKKSECPLLAFTYSEPTIFFEYMIETLKLAKSNGIKTAIVTSGFINKEPLLNICKYADAIKIDLKAFNEKYYKDICEGKLQPVLESLKTIKQQKIHLEIVYLVIPSLNDNPEEIKKMCSWIKQNLGKDIPLHFSRFFPLYKMQNYPATSLSTLENLKKLATNEGLKYVYIGNVDPVNSANSTYCPKCKKLLIIRDGYEINENNISNEKCKYCYEKIYGKWQ